MGRVVRNEVIEVRRDLGYEKSLISFFFFSPKFDEKLLEVFKQKRRIQPDFCFRKINDKSSLVAQQVKV